MYYITAVSSVTHQPSFQNKGFAKSMQALEGASDLIHPSYKEFIDAGLLRRMSKVLRMSVAAAIDCLAAAGIQQPDAIVVGTGLGCLQDTEKFLSNVLTLEGMIPPTSFIQSTHNTIAGQISLSLGNHSYNMTHTQNVLSFENALMDAMLLLAEGQNAVLTGAADEHIPFLNKVAEHLQLSLSPPLTSGSSFFVLSGQREKAMAQLVDVAALNLVDNISEEIIVFLKRNGYNSSDLSSLYTGALAENVLNDHFDTGVILTDYLKYSGLYPTASAFGLHLALEAMEGDTLSLICNRVTKSQLGLILVKSVEA